MRKLYRVLSSAMNSHGLGAMFAETVVLAGMVVGCSSLTGSRQPEGNLQPVRYSHLKHVGELELECTDCHLTVETAARASIPNIDVCETCHDDPAAEDSEQRKVGQYVADEERIPWRVVHKIPDHAFFSHRRHVTLAGIECTTCHGDVAKMDQPFEEPKVSLKMAWCVDCHEKSRASTDCYACHR